MDRILLVMFCYLTDFNIVIYDLQWYPQNLCLIKNVLENHLFLIYDILYNVTFSAFILSGTIFQLYFTFLIR